MSPGDYVGFPYLDCGRSESGCDCWGLVRIFYRREYAIYLPEHGGYESSTGAVAGALIEHNKTRWRRVDASMPGDVVLFNVCGRPAHVGVVLGKGMMLNSRRGADSCIECYHSSRWINRLEGFYRYDKTDRQAASL